jgi:hypothetical protein
MSCKSNSGNFTTEDTMETASHFICKDCLQTYEIWHTRKSMLKGGGEQLLINYWLGWG